MKHFDKSSKSLHVQDEDVKEKAPASREVHVTRTKAICKLKLHQEKRSSWRLHMLLDDDSTWSGRRCQGKSSCESWGARNSNESNM